MVSDIDVSIDKILDCHCMVLKSKKSNTYIQIIRKMTVQVNIVATS